MNEGKNGPKTDPCGKSALTIYHFEDWPLKINLWKLLCKNDSISIKSSKNIVYNSYKQTHTGVIRSEDWLVDVKQDSFDLKNHKYCAISIFRKY